MYRVLQNKWKKSRNCIVQTAGLRMIHMHQDRTQKLVKKMNGLGLLFTVIWNSLIFVPDLYIGTGKDWIWYNYQVIIEHMKGY